VAHKPLVWVALILSLMGCDLLKGKKDRPKDRDCEQEDCPKCPAVPSSSVSGGTSTADGMPGLCDAVGSFAAATDGVRAVMGDVELNRAGVPLFDAERIADVMVKQGGAESSEPAVAFAGILVRGKQQVWSTTIVSLPKTEARRKDLAKYLAGGRLPESATTPEIALGKRLAVYLGAKRGDEITVAAMPNMAVPGMAPSLRTVKIVGLLDIPGDPVIDYESGLAVMESEDIRTIALLSEGQWGGVRVWYKQGERAAGVLKLQDALRGQQMVNYITVDQSLAAIGALRPTLEAVCAGK
jgi:ABC-type lipoprotein release transport system permease subunit